MKKQFNISVPNPCSQKWESFTSTPRGGFCSQCKKEVIDFSRLSDDQVIDYFTKAAKPSCGKFRPDQLKRYQVIKPASATRSFVLKASIASFILLIFAKNAESQTKKQSVKIENRRDICNESLHPLPEITTVTITGVVKSAEDNTLMPGVNVQQYGSNNKTVTDADGKFTISLDSALYGRKLLFSFIGYQTAEYQVPTSAATTDVQIEMKMDTLTLGGIVVGGVRATRRISFRRWWWRLKGLF